MLVLGVDTELTKSLVCSDFKLVENCPFENYMVSNPGKCHFMCIEKNATNSEMLNLNKQILRNYRVGITHTR